MSPSYTEATAVQAGRNDVQAVDQPGGVADARVATDESKADTEARPATQLSLPNTSSPNRSGEVLQPTSAPPAVATLHNKAGKSIPDSVPLTSGGDPQTDGTWKPSAETQENISREDLRTDSSGVLIGASAGSASALSIPIPAQEQPSFFGGPYRPRGPLSPPVKGGQPKPADTKSKPKPADTKSKPKPADTKSKPE